MQPQPSSSEDPLGHKYFETLLSQCPATLQTMVEQPIMTTLPLVTENFTVTGIGSSEAHARFFVHLINHYTESKAYFLPLISFYKTDLKRKKDTSLVVFTQGMSPNAHIAINRRQLFQHLILFTGQTLQSNEVLKILYQERQTIIELPAQHEKGLLIRILGPLCGYLSILQFINHNWDNIIPPCNKDLSEVLFQTQNKGKSNSDYFLSNNPKNIILLLGSPLCEYSQNLAYKFLEGLFLPLPTSVDYLSFAHGTFQQWINDPKLIIFFTQNSSADIELYRRAYSMVEEAKSKTIEISSELTPPWNIFEYEMILNHLILAGIKKFDINQRNWPGKNLDYVIYSLGLS